MAGACRFTVLLLFYGILQLDTKLYVALTTAGTCGFLIAKVLKFDWSATNQTAIQGSSLLVSFTLAWIEVWLLDLRVVPQEQQARDCLNRNDFIRSESQRIAREHYHQYGDIVHENLRRSARNVLQRVADGPGSRFYTPLDSHNASDDDDDILQDPDKDVWLKQGKEAMVSVGEVLAIRKWVPVQSDDYTCVSTATSNGLDYYKVETVVEAMPHLLHQELFNNIEGMTSWNPTLQECSLIVSLNSSCDILYQVTQKRFGISQRDMVMLRRKGQISDLQAIVITSTTHPNFPARRNLVRGHCGPSCWAVREHSSRPGMCQVIGLLNVDLSLKLPKKIIRTAIAKSLLDVSSGIRTIAQKLQPFDS